MVFNLFTSRESIAGWVAKFEEMKKNDQGG